MTWFKVDDSLHAHAKVSKVTTEAPAALGLWLVAGSWCSANLTDGFVPDHKLPWLFPDAATLAPTLVTAGLWRRKRGGYQFHDWLDYNPSANSIKEDRNAARERMRKLRQERKEPGRGRERSGEQPPNVRDLFATPTRTSFRSSPARRAKCERHAGQLAASCGQCRGEALGGA